MSADRTRLGLEVEEALKEVLAHVRGEITLPCRIFGEPSAGRRDLYRGEYPGLRRRNAGSLPILTCSPREISIEAASPIRPLMSGQ